MVESLRIVTINVCGDTKQPRVYDRMATLPVRLAEVRPDIVLLQELCWPSDQAAAISKGLAELTGMPFQSYVTSLVAPNGWAEGLAIMTHLPADRHEFLQAPETEVFCHRVHIRVGDATLAVHNCHLDPYQCWRRRMQVEMMKDWSVDSPLSIIGGDFNSEPDAPELIEFRSLFNSAHAEVHGREPIYSTPTPLRFRPGEKMRMVDYLWVTPNLTIMDAGLVLTESHEGDPGLYCSDHFGISTTIRIHDACGSM